MAKNKKPKKSLLSEGAVRRMMKLAAIPELSESFFSETTKGERTEDDELAYEDPSKGERITQGDTKGEEAYGSPSKGEKKKGGGLAYMQEEDEEAELEATEDELGAEDAVADEEGAELEAEAPAEGEAEITPEAAQAIVDLAASLEASGALDGGGEVEAEAEVEDIGGEVEAEEEVEEIEESLSKLGIQVVDDHTINETVRKRVVARLLKEKRAQDKERTVNKLVDNIFARLQKRSK